MVDKKVKDNRKKYVPRREEDFTGIDKTIINNKVYWGRFKKGKLVEKTPSKNLTKEQALKNFKENNTIIPNRSIFTSRNFNEITRWDGRKPTRGKYQYLVEITILSKTKPLVITARSQSHPSNYPKELAKEEAWESAYERVSQTFGGAYDSVVGMKTLSKYKFAVREGVVWYQKR